MKAAITFPYKKVTKELLGVLNPRAREVIGGRFGLTTDGERKTLESIGRKYGITRERVRQIENFALKSIKKSDKYKVLAANFDEIKDIMMKQGGIVHEDEFLQSISKDRIVQNHIHFYMVLHDEFKATKENEHFNKHWSIEPKVTEVVHQALVNLHSTISDEEMVAESILLDRFLKQMEELHEVYKSKEMLHKYLSLSKILGKNQMGEWGKRTSPNIKTRGVKDYAYLVVRKANKPMHFREVSRAIFEEFKKKAHVATCHNELIRDPRFVLVGRGIYGLREWGHSGGIVRDVIMEVMNKEGRPLTKQEIIDLVKKERVVKENTVLVNLQNPKYFSKTEDGKFSIKPAN
jgi:predicted Zn-ribbon and HTH transcriptional regulator